MTSLFTKTTISQALKGDPECVEMATLDIIDSLNSCELDSLSQDQVKFLLSIVQQSLKGEKKRGRKPICTDDMLSVYIPMRRYRQLGCTKAESARRAQIEIKEKTGSVLCTRSYVNTFNELVSYGWKDPSPKVISKEEITE